MGFVENDSAITIDAVLTDAGREALARNDGSFELVRWTLADDEIDYGQFVASTGSLQQDLNIINTPVFEAAVNQKTALKNQLISISNPDLKFLPTLNPNVSSLTLGERTDQQIGKTLEFTQGTQSGRTVPSEIVDGSFKIELDNDLLFVEAETPVNITKDGTSQYILPRTAIVASQGSQVRFNVAVQALSNDVWDILGTGTVGSRTITARVKCEGANSGLNSEVTITINEEISR
jgi:hypothetical protein